MRRFFLFISFLLVACGAPATVAPTLATPTAFPYPTLTIQPAEVSSPTLPPQGPRTVTFTSEDGITLSGTLYGSGRVAVVFSHMFPTDQTSWTGLAQKLADLGYLALTYDFRGYGQSGGQVQIDQIDRDLRGATAFVREQGAEKVVLVGASMGGTATVKVAAADPRVAAIVAWSCPLSFRGLTVELAEASALAMPTLFLGAEADPATRDTRLMSETAPNAELFIYSGNSHGTFALETPQGAEVEAKLLSFIQEKVQP